MSSTKTVSRVAGVIALAAISMIVWQSTKVRQLAAAAARERADFRTQLEKLESRIAELDSREPALTTHADAGNAAAQADQLQHQKLAEERHRQQELAKRRAQEAKDRALTMRQFQFSRGVQQERFRQFELEMPVRYRPLYRMLGLSSEQVARFEDLVAERYWAYSDLLATRGTPGPAFEEQIFAELTQHTLAPFDEGMRTLLGEDGVEQYRHYERMAPAQGLIQSVASRLFDTSEPLSTAQADQLLAIFSAHNRRPDTLTPGETWLRARISGSESGANLQWTDIDWDPTRQELEGLLSPQQLAAVQALRDQAHARQQVKVLQDEFEQALRSGHDAGPTAAPR